MINQGKRFEQDFQESAKKVMSYIRLNDPGSSFNLECQNCPKKKTRFAPQHLCDAIAYKHPIQYLFELKSVKGKSVPFKNIIKNKKDKRLEKMVLENENPGIQAFVIFNFRTLDNLTYAVDVKTVLNFINSPSDYEYPENRKSIPLEWAKKHGVNIRNYIKKVRYSYFVEDIF